MYIFFVMIRQTPRTTRTDTLFPYTTLFRSAIATNAETSLRWLSRYEPNLEKIGQLTARVAASAHHASEIVQRIRGTAAKHMPDRISLDLNDIVEEAMLFVGHDIETRAIELTPTSTPLPVVMGDRVQLQQVIVNLLVNSIPEIGRAHV